MSTPDLVRRTGARVVLLDPAGRVLLLRGRDPTSPDSAPYWFTVGGGLEPGETSRQGAVRELSEETGLVLAEAELSGPVWHEVAEFGVGGRSYCQDQEFFVGHVAGAVEVDLSGRGEVELASIDQHRWWSVEELEVTAETVYPVELPTLVRAAAAGAPDGG